MGGEYLIKVVTLLGEVARRRSTGRLHLGAEGAGSLEFSAGELIGLKPPAQATPSTIPDGGGTPVERLRAAAGRTALQAAASGSDPSFQEQNGQDGPPSGLNAADLALDLSQGIGTAKALRLAFPDGDRTTLGPVASRPGVRPGLAWGEKERTLLSLVDGSRTMAQVVADSSLAEVETLQALFAFEAMGFLSGAVARAAVATAGVDKVSALDRFLAKTVTTVAAPEPPASKSESRSPAPASDPVPEKEPPPAGNLSPPEQEERETLQKKAQGLVGEDHYTVLGVDKRAETRVIRKAYYNLARTYHPDRLLKPHLEDIHGDLEKMFAVITEAYNILSDSSSREEYDRIQNEKMAGRSKDPRDNTVAARDSYLRGRKMMDAKKLFEAISLFETATKIDPSKSEYFYYLGLCQAQNPRWKKKAEMSLNKAIDMNPGEAQGYLALARLYQRGGLERRAQEMYGEVLKWDPTNEEALAAVEKENESVGGTGILRSIFKKS